MRSDPPIVVGDAEDHYLYEFSFAPAKPLPDDEREKYEAAQLQWLKDWRPYPWHFRQ